MRQGAVLQQELGFASIGGEDTVADEAFGDPGDDLEFSEFLRHRKPGRQDIGGRAGAAHDLEQSHDMRR